MKLFPSATFDKTFGWAIKKYYSEGFKARKVFFNCVNRARNFIREKRLPLPYNDVEEKQITREKHTNVVSPAFRVEKARSTASLAFLANRNRFPEAAKGNTLRDSTKFPFDVVQTFFICRLVTVFVILVDYATRDHIAKINVRAKCRGSSCHMLPRDFTRMHHERAVALNARILHAQSLYRSGLFLRHKMFWVIHVNYTGCD